MKKKKDGQGPSLKIILCAALGLCIVAIGGILGIRFFENKENKAPVVIAVIDTGISTRAIPAANVSEGKNYLDPSLSTEDTYGHGTAVASVILKNFPDAMLVPLVSSAYNNGRIEQVDNDVFAEIITDAVDVYRCNIINLAVGLIPDKPAVREAIAYAEEKGVLVVASAGNDYDTDGEFTYYPAAYETVLAVGSVNKEGTSISDFSQRGEWVDLYAPGEDVEISTLSGNTKVNEGTSYSAAFVSARAALLLQERPDLTPAEVRKELSNAAEPLKDGKIVLK